MNINLNAERVSPYYKKISSFWSPATALHVLFSVSLLAFAVQGIPYLAVHTANVIGSVQMGYWLAGGAAVIFFATILWIFINEN